MGRATDFAGLAILPVSVWYQNQLIVKDLLFEWLPVNTTYMK